MFLSLVSSRQDSIFSTIGCSSRIWARTRASVEKPVLPRRLRVSPSFSKRMRPTCCGEPIVNSSSASSKISFSRVSIRSPKPAPTSARRSASSFSPSRSIAASTWTSGSSTSRSSGSSPSSSMRGRWTSARAATRRASSAGSSPASASSPSESWPSSSSALAGARRPRRGRSRRRRRARSARRCGAAARAGRRRASCRGRARARPPRGRRRRAGRGGRRRATWRRGRRAAGRRARPPARRGSRRRRGSRSPSAAAQRSPSIASATGALAEVGGRALHRLDLELGLDAAAGHRLALGQRFFEPLQHRPQLELAHELAQGAAVGLATPSPSPRSTPVSMSYCSVASCFDMRASSACSTRFCLRLAPEISSTLASTSSSEPNCCSSWVAVFSPIPGTPGMLSEVSPRSPIRSVTSSGGTP